jgi:hypothetical protein
MGPILLAIAFPACRSASGLEGGVVGGIGHDACAVMLALDVKVQDERGTPVPGAELWELTRPQPDPPLGKAWRLGVTDDGGHLRALDCYMGSREFRFWRPQDEPVVLDLMVLRIGLGAERTTLRPDTVAVLRDGNLLGVSPEEYQLGHEAPPDPERSRRAFSLPVTVTLRHAPH